MEGRPRAQTVGGHRRAPVWQDLRDQSVRPGCLRRRRLHQLRKGQSRRLRLRHRPRPGENRVRALRHRVRSARCTRQDAAFPRRDSSLPQCADLPQVLLRRPAGAPCGERRVAARRRSRPRGGVVPRGQGRPADDVPDELPGVPRGDRRCRQARPARIPPARQARSRGAREIPGGELPGLPHRWRDARGGREMGGAGRLCVC